MLFRSAAARALTQVGQPERARAAVAHGVPMYNRLMTNAQLDHNTLVSLAEAYSLLGNLPKMEEAMDRLVKLTPNNPEAFYDLAAIQTVLSKSNLAVQNLSHAIQLSDQRMGQQTNVANLRQLAPKDPRFTNLWAMPGFQAAITSPPAPAAITIKRAGDVPFAAPPGIDGPKAPLPVVPPVTLTNAAGPTSAVPPVKK